jgi:hypothetical protein
VGREKSYVDNPDGVREDRGSDSGGGGNEDRLEGRKSRPAAPALLEHNGARFLKGGVVDATSRGRSARRERRRERENARVGDSDSDERRAQSVVQPRKPISLDDCKSCRTGALPEEKETRSALPRRVKSGKKARNAPRSPISPRPETGSRG